MKLNPWEPWCNYVILRLAKMTLPPPHLLGKEGGGAREGGGGASRSQSALHMHVLVCICSNVRQFRMITGMIQVCYHTIDCT